MKVTKADGPQLYELYQAGKLEGLFDVESRDYHMSPGASNSNLKIILEKSPRHLRAMRERPRRVSKEMRLGSAIHTAILEPEKFDNEYKLAADKPVKPDRPPELKGKRKNPKNEDCPVTAWEAIALQTYEKAMSEYEANQLRDQREEITQSTLDQIIEITEMFNNHPKSTKILKGSLIETSVYSKDPVTGIQTKVRPDIWNPKSGIIFDPKTTKDASPEAFSKAVNDLKYHMQAAFYMDTIERVTGVKPKAWIWIAIEKEFPYEIAIYHIGPRSLAVGRALYREALDKYAACKKREREAKNDIDKELAWGGYSKDVEPLEIPEWALRRFEYADS